MVKSRRFQLNYKIDDVGPSDISRVEVYVTRDGGKPAVVILSLEDFASFEETEYLLKSPTNSKRLKAAVERLASGHGTERDLIE
jgi:PHD/YefM family antitoxin component YafN of YafNO toxin-antitoxin module